MKYFLSPATSLKESPAIWKKHYTIGELDPGEYSKEKRHIIVRLRNMNMHRKSFCYNVLGYFGSVAQMLVNKPVTAKETACSLEGDEYHEFTFTW